ncbi:MAG: hypothetical protein N3F09_00625 [Bacteroidia bacterium]|nr:hypothetical protein [Bacteroidia bacterium]
MNLLQTYINRFAYPHTFLKDFRPKFLNIVIPSHCEEHLPITLQSIHECRGNRDDVNVVVVLNHSEDDLQAAQFHREQWAYLNKASFDSFNLYVVYAEFPKKTAGVGMARKAGMDEVIRHCTNLHMDSWLICLDADCKVDKNYIKALSYVCYRKEVQNLCIHFEHPYQEESNLVLKEGIIAYELFLRYYRHALHFTGHPHAYYTIGSSMGTRIKNYVKSGGMNKRKAGEDFYFLGKLFVYGGTYELTETTVYPSCRISRRVPFGTGNAQMKYFANPDKSYPVYDFGIFEMLREFLTYVKEQKSMEDLYQHPFWAHFLRKTKVEKILQNAKENATSDEAYFKRVFQNLDIFFMLKAVHFLRDYSGTHSLSPLLHNVKKLTQKDFSSHEEALEFFRTYDRLRLRDFNLLSNS